MRSCISQAELRPFSFYSRCFAYTAAKNQEYPNNVLPSYSQPFCNELRASAPFLLAQQSPSSLATRTVNVVLSTPVITTSLSTTTESTTDSTTMTATSTTP